MTQNDIEILLAFLDFCVDFGINPFEDEARAILEAA